MDQKLGYKNLWNCWVRMGYTEGHKDDDDIHKLKSTAAIPRIFGDISS